MSTKRILDIMKVKDVGDTEVGIEIEMEGVDLIHDNTGGWNYHEDGSLRGESAEYVLRKPIPRDKVAFHLDQLQSNLTKKGSKLKPSDRCGVHVHVNCQKLTVPQVFNFALLYLTYEDLLVRFCGSDREGNLFCLRAKDAEYVVVGLAAAAKSGSLNELQSNLFRYASINMSALSKYGSVEFRAMRTPKDFGIINTWTGLLLAVKDASMKYELPAAMLEDISKIGVARMTEKVFGLWAKDLVYAGYEEDVMTALRRVQRVAYQYKVPKEPELKKDPASGPQRRGRRDWAGLIANTGVIDKIVIEHRFRHENLRPNQLMFDRRGRQIWGLSFGLRRLTNEMINQYQTQIQQGEGRVFNTAWNLRDEFLTDQIPALIEDPQTNTQPFNATMELDGLIRAAARTTTRATPALNNGPDEEF